MDTFLVIMVIVFLLLTGYYYLFRDDYQRATFWMVSAILLLSLPKFGC